MRKIDRTVGKLVLIEAFIAEWTVVDTSLLDVFALFLLHVLLVQRCELVLVCLILDPRGRWDDVVAVNAALRARPILES